MPLLGLRRRDLAGLAALALAPRTTHAEAPAKSLEPAAAGVFEVDFPLVERLTAPVLLNDKGPFQFIVDTGANRSLVSGEAARALGLELGAHTQVHSVGGARSAPTATIEKVRVGRRTRRRMLFCIADRAHLKADGLLGVEWLTGQHLLLDFGRRRLQIGPPPAELRLDPDVVVVPTVRRSGGLSFVTAEASGAAVIAFLDSGSDLTVGNLAFLRMLRARAGLVGEGGAFELRGAMGETLVGQVAVVRALQMAGLRVRNLPVVFADVHTFGVWNLQAQPCLLVGLDLLGVFESVALDFRRGEAHFRVRLRG